MDDGLGVQWPLSPFATAIATGALFAFCVAFWNKRPNKRPTPKPGSESDTNNTLKGINCSKVVNECTSLVKRHVLQLEVPTDVINASSFGFSPVSVPEDEDRQNVLTFAWPRIRKSSDCVTIKLLDFDGRFTKFKFGPYFRDKINLGIPFSIFNNPSICFPNPDPRENLKFTSNPTHRKSIYNIKYFENDLTQENCPTIVKNYHQIDQRFLNSNNAIGPITSLAKRIIYHSNTKNILVKKLTSCDKKTQTVFTERSLEQISNEEKCDSERKIFIDNSLKKLDGISEIKSGDIACNNLNAIEENVIYQTFKSDTTNSNKNITEKLNTQEDICLCDNLDLNEIEIKSLINIENVDVTNICLNSNKSDILKVNNLHNTDSYNQNSLNLLKKYIGNEKYKIETNLDDFRSFDSELQDFGNILSGDKDKKCSALIENPVHLSVEYHDNTYGSSNCQTVKCEEETSARALNFGNSINHPKTSLGEEKSMKENLDNIQKVPDKKEAVMTTRKSGELSLALETKQTCTVRKDSNRSESTIDWKVGKSSGGGGTTTNDRDVRGKGETTSRTRTSEEEREARSTLRQMDRRTGERTEVDSEAACVFETCITSETLIQENGGTRVSAAVTSSVTVDTTTDLWPCENGVVKTVVTTNGKYTEEEVFRPTYEEYMPDASKSLDATINELNEIADRPLISSEPTSPRVDRLKALLDRDEERRARMKFIKEKNSSSVNGSGGARASIDGEWDRILRDVLASVSELEHWEKDEEQRRRCDVTIPKREDAEERPKHRNFHSDSSPSMEGEAAVISPTKGETPTKVKNLRFKLDPDVFDVPSDDSFYDDDDDDPRRSAGNWRRQSKYRTFSSLELGDEPVKLVSVHASVVPAGQKLIARPVGIDLHVRLTEERQSKRAHVGTSPSQVKRRSPVSDSRVGWCQELSPVTENVDWRENFTTVSKEANDTVTNGQILKQVPNGQTTKPVPNGILKTPSPKTEQIIKDSANPFKVEGELTNGKQVVTPKKIEKPVTNGIPKYWKPPEKKLSLPRKKFIPDPDAVDRITGYKLAVTKPPLPPPVFQKVSNPSVKTSRAELARKQYLDHKASLVAAKTDGNAKFQEFLAQTQSDRARIITSVPDLGAIEKAVSEQWARERTPTSQRTSPARDDIPKSGETLSSRGSTPDDAWTSYVQSCRKHLGRRSQSMTYLESNVELVDIPILEDDDKWRSTSALVEPDNSESSLPLEDSDFDRSQDDLDDSGRAKSEHELRIQRSLQSLPLPSWYKQSEKPKTGFLLGSGSKEKRGWAAAKSLASSTSSLTSCGLKRPIRSLRSSRENIPWSRGSPSPDGPALSLALARAFREPYLGWRARASTTSSGVSSSPRTSPPSWSAVTTDEEVNGVSFDGEDAFGQTSSQEDQDRRDDPPSLDDTGADVATVSMDTGELGKLPGGEDTCDDINNMSMDTCELFDISIVPDAEEQPSPQADTGDDIDNLSTDTTEDKRKDPKFKRYSYSQSIYNSEWEEDEESRGDFKSLPKDLDNSPSSDSNKVIWIESSFVGSRTTTSIMVLPEGKMKREGSLERPASR